MFHVPPKNQGQIVEVAYAMVGDQVVEQTTDRSDGQISYRVSRALAGDSGDYWNGAPRNRRWRDIDADAVREMIADAMA